MHIISLSSDSNLFFKKYTLNRKSKDFEFSDGVDGDEVKADCVRIIAEFEEALRRDVFIKK